MRYPPPDIPPDASTSDRPAPVEGDNIAPISPVTPRRRRRIANVDALVPMPFALVFALAAMVAFAFGGWLWWLTSGLGDPRATLTKTLTVGVPFSFALWIAWLVVSIAVVQRLGRTLVPVDRLLREAGLACWPLFLALGMAIPAVSFGVGLVAIGGWVAATQAALARVAGRTGRGVLAANLAGFALWCVVMSLLASGDHAIAPGPFVAESIWEAVTSQGIVVVAQ
ncbi:MAG: hypothetical protein C4558_09930 [Dehalococcoidia bacterium]|nr:MAG: hypothetical protein C4558_09930 [Dehalococcoidia bacterium]